MKESTICVPSAGTEAQTNTTVETKDSSANIATNAMLAEVSVDRITPKNITSIAENEVFVFGSNLSGWHGKGAAKTALGWGAKWGQAAGLQGKTYGIPTKDAAIKRILRIDEIKPFVDDFIKWVKCHTNNTFYVTEIGCGLAGYKPKDIAPLFAECVNFKNVKLPKRFWHNLGVSNFC
jgi:hypothetical protein